MTTNQVDRRTMKYHEIHEIQFVQCNEIDSKVRHEKKLIDGCCDECIELYEDLKGDIIEDFEFNNKDRKVWDIMEISHHHDSKRLSFAVWSIAK